VSRRFYDTLQAIGRGEHNRPAVGSKPAIWGRKVGPADRENYDVHISVNAVAELTKLPVSTAQRTLTHLELHKHSIGDASRRAKAWRARRGEPRGHRVPDPAIGTTC